MLSLILHYLWIVQGEQEQAQVLINQQYQQALNDSWIYKVGIKTFTAPTFIDFFVSLFTPRLIV